ncbi:MAG: hypothetical protein BWY95_02256 [Bacteroidetes bacterium ADurb.BinA104]|nr:MAG: hypothetical protein BWY95_02256 [Bacteroidetes bacterium ADurb.BinA104]
MSSAYQIVVNPEPPMSPVPAQLIPKARYIVPVRLELPVILIVISSQAVEPLLARFQLPILADALLYACPVGKV